MVRWMVVACQGRCSNALVAYRPHGATLAYQGGSSRLQVLCATILRSLTIRRARSYGIKCGLLCMTKKSLRISFVRIVHKRITTPCAALLESKDQLADLPYYYRCVAA
jgi:hypothetical protein